MLLLIFDMLQTSASTSPEMFQARHFTIIPDPKPNTIESYNYTILDKM